jgi:hypothetical protein
MKRVANASWTALIAGLFFIFATRPALAAGEGATGTESHGLDPAVLIGVALMLVFAKLGGEIFERFKTPAVLGELVAVMVLVNLVILGFNSA